MKLTVSKENCFLKEGELKDLAWKRGTECDVEIDYVCRNRNISPHREAMETAT